MEIIYCFFSVSGMCINSILASISIRNINSVSTSVSANQINSMQVVYQPKKEFQAPIMYQECE
jgi:hypothetical protein